MNSTFQPSPTPIMRLDWVKQDWQALLFTVSLHLLLLTLMLGWQLSSEPEIHQPDYVRARLVQLNPEIAQHKPEPKTEPRVESRPEPRVDPQEEQKKQQQKKQQEELKKQQEAKKQQELKKQQEAEKQRLARDKQAKEKLAQEKAAKEKAAQEKAAKEKQLKEQAAAEKRRAEEALARALAEEQAQQQRLADVELAQAYATLIKQQVERNWSRPPSARKGMEAWLEIQLVPTGYIAGVKLIKSSGNVAFDLSAEQAVQKVERFDEIKNMPSRVFESQFRRFTLKFHPEDKLY